MAEITKSQSGQLYVITGPSTTVNYNVLQNKPILNVSSLPSTGTQSDIYKVGNTLWVWDGTQFVSVGGGSGSGGRFIFTQTTAALSWNIQHNLNFKYVQVMCLDASDNQIVGTVSYTDLNNCIVTFSSSQTGVAIVRS